MGNQGNQRCHSKKRRADFTGRKNITHSVRGSVAQIDMEAFRQTQLSVWNRETMRKSVLNGASAPRSQDDDDRHDVQHPNRTRQKKEIASAGGYICRLNKKDGTPGAGGRTFSYQSFLFLLSGLVST